MCLAPKSDLLRRTATQSCRSTSGAEGQAGVEANVSEDTEMGEAPPLKQEKLDLNQTDTQGLINKGIALVL